MTPISTLYQQLQDNSTEGLTGMLFLGLGGRRDEKMGSYTTFPSLFANLKPLSQRC